MRDRVDGVIIVTTGNFTKDALDEADQYNLKLISGDILTGMLNKKATALIQQKLRKNSNLRGTGKFGKMASQ